jgi:hypothetical protein
MDQGFDERCATGRMVDEAVGGCQCGQVRYRLEGEAIELTVCHCRECQRQSGSAFGMSLSIPASALEILRGTVRFFDVICDSGRTKSCAFCPNCGTRIYHRTDAGISIKAGTLDDTSGLRPTAHYWTSRKQPWVAIADDVCSFPDDG